mmetsp:Transcript_74895/g.126110  ORF Transcript_74895/g.126110 Transcript_74895/m.126110 type:complete len:103 (-) Transcript_74895:922-1230(-)
MASQSIGTLRTSRGNTGTVAGALMRDFKEPRDLLVSIIVAMRPWRFKHQGGLFRGRSREHEAYCFMHTLPVQLLIPASTLGKVMNGNNARCILFALASMANH